jgi:O-antigen/teichoic acid export membrane protein
LKRHAVRGGIVVGTAQIIRIALQMISVVVLARLLSPDDFGLVAAVTPLIAFISMFQDLGYSQAIVQRKEITDEQISLIFWTTTALGLLCAAATILASPAVAWFFRDRRLFLITIAASVSVLLGSLMAVPSGLLNRNLKFVELSIADVVGALAGFVSALIAALLGARYWSLIIASTVSSLVIVVGYWKNAGWKPRRPKAQFVDREIGSFGANLTGSAFASYFANNLDNVLIGREGGSVQLGYYDRAYKLLYFPIQNINGPLYRVMTPLLSRVQDDGPRFREMFLRASGQLTLLLVPGMAAMVAVSRDIVTVLFGARWLPVAPIFFFLGVNGLLLPLGNATTWIFIAQGRTDVMFRVSIFSSIVTVASFFVGLHFGGAVGLAAAYAFVEYFIKWPVQYTVLHRVGPVSAPDLIWQQVPLLAAAGGTLLIAQFVLRGQMGLHGIPLIALATLLSYALSIAVTALRPGGRAVLSETGGLISHLLGMMRQ